MKIHEAASSGNLDAVQSEVQSGVSVDAIEDNGCTPLHYACKYCRPSIVSALVKLGADTGIRDLAGNLPIELAAACNCIEVVKVLLSHGAITHTDAPRFCALHSAAAFGNEEMVDLLIASGVNLEEVADGEEGRTAMHWAVQEGHYAIVSTLLDNNANVNSQDENGYTPLIQAVSEGNLDIVQLLLRRGANPNLSSKSCSTALHLAYRWTSPEMINLLLQYGADPNALDSEGRKAKDLAKSR